MAEKDVATGWGTLPAGLEFWACPGCKEYSPVFDWTVSTKIVNQRRLGSRVCPKCGYNAATLSDTDAMSRADLELQEKRRAHEEKKTERELAKEK